MTRRSFVPLLVAGLPSRFAAGEPEPRRTPIFDGQSLRGWSIQEGPESAFYAQDGHIAGSPSSGFPAWLRSDREYENFDFQCEFFVKGWTDGGIYFHAPEHGRRSWAGFKVNLFHQVDKVTKPNSMGSIYPLIPPHLVNVRGQGEWNTLRIRMDWPKLQVWVNGEPVQDLDVETVPELRYRLRRGYFGLETLSYPIGFRNLAIAELPDKEQWDVLYEHPSDLEKWTLTELNPRSPARFQALGPVLRADGLGNLTTREQYRDFALQMYLRGIRHHNGDILFRSRGGKDHYEIQMHDVEEAHYPTGSLYHYKRSIYPRIEPEQWFLFQLFVKDRWCLVRINGDTALEYGDLDKLQPGFIELQAHQADRWIEYKRIRVKRL